MTIYFPFEFRTHVFRDGDYIVIQQWNDELKEEPIGEVRLTRHQFDQMFNHQKRLDDDVDA